MKIHSPLPRLASGAGLVEVLVLILVLGVGMLSMAKLHGLILRDGGSANNRAIAMQLAQAKIDELRGFKCTKFETDTACTNAGGETDFNSITSGNDTINSLDGTNLNDSFTRSWISTSYYLCGSGTTASTTNPCAKPYPDFKTVAVTVTWTDANGAQSVALTASIYAADAYSMAIAGGGVGTAYTGPQVKHTPGTTPEVVPVWISGDTKREASKPVPDVTQHGISTVTTFTVVNYMNGSNAVKSEEEFSTINCTCTQAGENQGEPVAIVLDDDQGDDGDNINEKGVPLPYPNGAVAKRTGTKKTGGQFNEQPALCDTCCRDHHDKNTLTYRFDPYRPFDSTNFPGSLSGDHSHMGYDGSNALVTRDANGDEYLEACRFRRVNGYWYVTSDWQLEALVVQPKSYFNSNLSEYQSAVAAGVKAYISAIDSSTYPQTRPTLSISLPNKQPADTAINIDSTTSASPLELYARAIYIDRLTPEQITYLKAHINDADILSKIPFYEVNVTRLATWTSANTGVATVSSEALTDSTETTYTRGKVVKGSTTGTSTITATILKSNTGLIDSKSIDTHDAQTASGYLTVQTTGTAPSGTTRYVYGAYTAGGTVDKNKINTAIYQGANCTAINNNNAYWSGGPTCTSPDGCYRCTCTDSGSGCPASDLILSVTVKGSGGDYAGNAFSVNSAGSIPNCYTQIPTSGITNGTNVTTKFKYLIPTLSTNLQKNITFTTYSANASACSPAIP